MSTIYKHLAKEDLKLEKEKPVTLPTEKMREPSLTGMKVSIVLIFLLSLAAAVGAGFLYQSFNGEKRQRQALESAHRELEQKAASRETQASQYRTEMDRMREQLKSYVSERDQVKRELEKGRIEISNLQKKIQVIEERNKAIEEQALRIQTETPAEPLLAAAASSAPAAGSGAGAPAEAANKTFQVLTVNRKFNFAVVNLGVRDGLKMGEKIVVERNGKSAGTLQVEKLYDHFAAATIAEEPQNTPIKEGDVVRRPS